MQAGTIVIVEDNFDVRRLTRAFLERAGYSVVTASDGEEGLDVFRKLQPRISLLLTDITMPWMNGFELADQVLQFDPTLPLLFVSGGEFTSNRGIRCIPKPFTPGELLRYVARALSAGAKPREQRILKREAIH